MDASILHFVSWVSLWNHAASLKLHSIGPGNYKVLLHFRGKRHQPPPPNRRMSGSIVKTVCETWCILVQPPLKDYNLLHFASIPISFPNLVSLSNYVLVLQHSLQFCTVFLISHYSPGFTNMLPILKSLVKNFFHTLYFLQMSSICDP